MPESDPFDITNAPMGDELTCTPSLWARIEHRAILGPDGKIIERDWWPMVMEPGGQLEMVVPLEEDERLSHPARPRDGAREAPQGMHVLLHHNPKRKAWEYQLS
jgi:hypothetical protein